MPDQHWLVLPEYFMGIHLPALVPYVALVFTVVFILSILPGLIMIERWGMALIQDRSGPNRVGPRGALQSTADVVKLFFKEDTRPTNVDVRLYYLAPVLVVITAIGAGAVFPLGWVTFKAASDGHIFTTRLQIGDVNIGLLYILAMSSLQVYGLVLAGWASNNKYSLLGGLRASAQLISYELSMGLSLMSVVVLCGSVNLSDVVVAQNVLPWAGAPEILRGSIFTWFWLRSGLIPVIIYTIAMFAETNRAPFDLPEAESELIAGYHTEYTSMKFAMFFTAEYVAMLMVSGLNASIFWGGPLPIINIPPFNLIPGPLWFALKVMIGIFLFVWVRFTIPRLRYDALMSLGWKRMLPLGLVWLFIVASLNLELEPHETTRGRIGSAGTVPAPATYRPADPPKLAAATGTPTPVSSRTGGETNRKSRR